MPALPSAATALLLRASQALMRFNQWRAAATLLARLPLASLNETARGRLSYALLMLHRTSAPAARALLRHVLQANGILLAPILVELATMAVRTGDEPLARELLARAMAAANDTATLDAAATLLQLHTAHANGTLRSRIAALVDEACIASTGPLTLVPVSSRYLDLWALWLEQVRTHIGGTVVAIALDDEVLASLHTAPDVAVIDAREFFAWNSPGSLHDASRGVLWQLRTLSLRELVHRGRAVLVLDLDAIVLAPLQPLFDALPNEDLIAQKDHSLPMDVDRQLGFIVCCGFMLWRATPAALALLDRFATETMIERDDQMALNHILGREGIAHRTEDAQAMRFIHAGVTIACPRPHQVSRTLYSGAVVRHFQQEGQTIPQLREALGLPPQSHP